MQIQSISNLLIQNLEQKDAIPFQSFNEAIIQQNDPNNQNNYTSIECIKGQKVLFVQIENTFSIKIGQKVSNQWKIQEIVLQQNLGLQFLSKTIGAYQNVNSKPKQLLKTTFKSAFKAEGKISPDLLVKDIYGPDSSSIGIPGFILASSLGKVAKEGRNQFPDVDLYRSIFITFAINVAQLCGLSAQAEKINEVIIRNHSVNEKLFNRYIYTLAQYYNPAASIWFEKSSRKIQFS